MRVLHGSSRPASANQPGRNDPCPCGSGRKYKQCCAGKPVTTTPAWPASSPPGHGEAELEQIRALRSAGRLVEAVRQARNYVARHANDPAGHAVLGMVHLAAGRAEEALPCCMQAVRLAPDVAAHHKNAGFALVLLGRDGEAITAFRRTLALQPNDAEALDQLGALLLKYDLRAEALDCFRRASEAEPETALGRMSRARLLFADGKPAEGEAWLRETIALHPAHTEAKRYLASHLREAGRVRRSHPLA